MYPFPLTALLLAKSAAKEWSRGRCRRKRVGSKGRVNIGTSPDIIRKAMYTSLPFERHWCCCCDLFAPFLLILSSPLFLFLFLYNIFCPSLPIHTIYGDSWFQNSTWYSSSRSSRKSISSFSISISSISNINY